jgi:hypothetical protein
MKRIVAIVAGVVVVLVVVGGIVVLAASDGPTAVKVGSAEVSQQDVDDELREIGTNDTLAKNVEQARQPALSNTDGSLTAEISAGWLRLLVSQEVAAQAVERRGLEITSADRDRAHDLAVGFVGGNDIWKTFPKWWRDRFVARWAPVAVLEREVTEDPPPALLQQLGAQCPSGRFVSHILVESETEAQALKQELDAGADFAALARSSSSDTQSARRGGALGCADGQQFVEPFATVVANQPIGVVSDPVTTQFGSHLVLVTDEPPAALVQQYAIDLVLGRARGKAVHIDPRYGTWDRASGQVIPPGVAAQPSPLP